MSNLIDVVIPWVDGDDPKWKKEFVSWKKKMDSSYNEISNSAIRYADWGTLKYWFRSVEKCMPWVNKFFL